MDMLVTVVAVCIIACTIVYVLNHISWPGGPWKNIVLIALAVLLLLFVLNSTGVIGSGWNVRFHRH
jgi:hypothetical protein